MYIFRGTELFVRVFFLVAKQEWQQRACHKYPDDTFMYPIYC
ncbi:conserved hypothetical protein [Xenorhabdus nematophila F1]|uniref:Uncharacterized protein n=1 Tax=Xenorhabdus nematophila (strain ATCC 19061 / DSM 3370 / CCUG 14189 / LMG 1036 / NCIMB 9965 / AN6) TaxID=406817 RepID=D3VF81_XENNA|nr:hypothetical protein XNC1_4516 [Xenorhabdus nematophila ATCC 19061]CCW31375.1 conserved hypothetical protein [Xenorhabdus nematophila F1]